MRRFLSVVVVACLGLAGAAAPASGQGRPISVIRDAEIEHIIRVYVEPIFVAAGLSPRAVGIHIVDDPDINAFVAGGQNLFINTGLLLQAQSPSELIGVLAHETGHIAGGHLARGEDAVANARRSTLLTALLGVAAAVATGRSDAGVAAMAGGATLAERGLLGYTRTMESSADQAGLRYMDMAGISAEGILSFLERLEDQELLPESRQVEYTRTHPITRDRVEAVRAHVERSAATGRPLPAGYDAMFQRMQAKILAFMTPQIASRRYGPDDTSVAGRYARAIAAYKRSDLPTALALMDTLLAEAPNDAYFHETRGQILLENGRLAEARRAYEQAVALAPGEPLLLIPLAQTKLDSGDPADLPGAIADLTQAVRADSGDVPPLAWRLLATAQGRAGDMGQAALALAEEALAQGDDTTAQQQATRAQQTLRSGSPGWLRAQDIQQLARRRAD